MKLFTTILLIALSSCPSLTKSGELLEIENEFIIPLPEDWVLENDSSDYPYRITEINQSAELFIFRSIISTSEAMNDETDLRAAVEMVIAEVLPELSDPELVRSSGYLSGDRASFVLDFIAADIAMGAKTYHRLNGILYRLPNQDQVLFTLWAKTTPENFPFHEPAFDLMLSGFSFRGSREPKVFIDPAAEDFWYPVMLLGLMIGLIYYLGRIRRRRHAPQFRDQTNFWHCTCGRVNPNRLATCRRCGGPQDESN